MSTPKKAKAGWLNRIVEHAEVAPKDLVAHPYNARTHPTPQEQALVGSINDVGFYRSVTVNKRTGHILDGHLRVELAIKQGQKTIPVEYVDIPEELEAEVLLTADPLAALAEYNKESLDHLLREISTSEPALQQMLADLAKESGLSYGETEPVRSSTSQLGAMEYRVIVVCEGEKHQGELLARFESEGLSCQALIS